MNWYSKVLKQYADFNGRARRTEYWMFTLFNVLAMMALVFVLGFLFDLDNPISLILIIFYYLVIIIPALAVTVRRLHDVGKSGWNILFGMIPLVGPILLFVWYCTDSETGKNKWGNNTKDIGNDTAIEYIGKE